MWETPDLTRTLARTLTRSSKVDLRVETPSRSVHTPHLVFQTALTMLGSPLRLHETRIFDLYLPRLAPDE